jgi:hypothetical protein
LADRQEIPDYPTPESVARALWLQMLHEAKPMTRAILLAGAMLTFYLVMASMVTPPSDLALALWFQG